MTVKTKSMLLSITILTFLTLILTVRMIVKEQDDLAYLSKNQHLLIDRQQQFTLQMVYQKSLAHLVTVSHSQELLQAFRADNKDLLYQFMKPIYDDLQTQSLLSLSVYSFYLPDGTVLLHMRKPEHMTDKPFAEKLLLKKALETGKITSGFEVGLFGLYYKIAYPIIEDNKVLGAIDIGVDFNSLHIPMDLHYPIKSLTLIPYEVGMQSSLAPVAKNFDTAYFIYGDETAIPILRDSEEILNDVIFHYHPRDYLPHITEIKDTQGRLLAKCIYLGDITDEYGRKQHDILTHIGIGVIALILLTFVLHKAFNEMISQLLISEQKYKDLSLSLEKKVKTQTAYILQQSRLAQMGEMLSMIAHQWRQPLASISAITGVLQLDIAMNNYRKSFFEERLESITQLSRHLSSTIDDFRDFFKETKVKTETDGRSMVEAGLAIIGLSLSNKGITVYTGFESDQKVITYPNEVKQVILNILKNAEDALQERGIKEPAIWINTYDRDDGASIVIEDNAGGIPEAILEKIFDPYFSTKNKKNGTGLGLYMSKTIIEEHCKGLLYATNTDKGARFEIILFKEEEQL